MKSALRMSAVVLIILAFVVTTGLAAESKYSGFLDNYNNLQPGPEGGVKMRWLNPNVDLAKYNKFMVESVVFFFADDSQYKGIDPQEMKELADTFNQELITAIQAKYAISMEPGPDVMRIRIAITGLKASKPGVSTVSSLLPIGLVFSAAKKGASGSWSGSGATGAEAMFLDSMTNEVIGQAVDERTAGFSERFSKWGSAQEAFKFWAGRFVQFIDSQKAGKKVEAAPEP